MDIIHSEYGIPMDSDFEEEVKNMCNLSQDVKEKGIEEGFRQATRSIIIGMYKNGLSVDEISKFTKSTIEFVEDTIHGYETGRIDADGREKMIV